MISRYTSLFVQAVHIVHGVHGVQCTLYIV